MGADSEMISIRLGSFNFSVAKLNKICFRILDMGLLKNFLLSYFFLILNHEVSKSWIFMPKEIFLLPKFLSYLVEFLL